MLSLALWVNESFYLGLSQLETQKHGGLEQQICIITTSNTHFKQDVIQVPEQM